MTARLGRAFFARDAREVARDLVGKYLVHATGEGVRGGRVVEVEAYLGPEDRASHARFGPEGRSRPMFGPAGVAYVFFVYGMHECFNVVTGEEGQGQAVLFRALEPLPGTARCDGPGRLTRALAIDRRHNERSLLVGGLRLCDRGEAPPCVVATARIGVGYAGAWARRRLRFCDAASAALSAPIGPRRRSKGR